MADQIEAKEFNLWDLMSGEFVFNIPDYQRPYSWTQNESVTLWDDLVEFWENKKENKEHSYFVGSIVLVKSSSSPEAQVIDGQQRLTTLSIILSILMDCDNEWKNDIKKCLWEEGIQHKGIPGRPRLTLREKDRDFFEKYIANCHTEELLDLDIKSCDDDAKRLIKNNTSELKKKIMEFAVNNSTTDLIKTLFDKCYFVVVSTTDNESAFRVFSVMNNRGLSLLPSDIIKAHVIGGIAEKERKKYTERWEDIEAVLGREAFNSLLSYIRMIYAKNKLHGTLVSEFERIIFKNVINKEEVISSIIEPYAQAYQEIINCSYVASYGAEYVNELFRWMLRVDDSDWVPAMMYALVHNKENDFMQKFTMSIERLAAYFYLTSKTSNQRIERYGQIINKLQNGEEADALATASLSSKEQQALIEVLDGDVYLLPARKRSFLVMRLDRIISDKAAVYKNDVFSIEHVLPQNPKEGSKWLEDWPDDQVREYWTHKLANLVPLTRKKNSQAQNYDFEEKKKKYFSEAKGITSYAITTSIMQEKEWTPYSVSDRQKRLLGAIAEYWLLTVWTSTEEKSGLDETNVNEMNWGEMVLQEKLKAELEKYHLSNPNSKLPKIAHFDAKVGLFVRENWHLLVNSGYSLSEEVFNKLCTVEGSKKYTHRNLPFILVKNDTQTKEDTKRYWSSPKYIEQYKGTEYYIFSEWYPDTHVSKDAHKSDFLQLLCDIAKGDI